MSEAPERIWAYERGLRMWRDYKSDRSDLQTEYVRADRIEELEAKLAKAVEAFRVLSDYENLGTSGGYYDGECCILSYQARKRYGDFDEIARTTLAELTSSVAADNEVKGGKDE